MSWTFRRIFPQLLWIQVVDSRGYVAHHTFSSEVSSAVTNVVARFSVLGPFSWACPGNEGLWSTLGPPLMSGPAYLRSLLLFLMQRWHLVRPLAVNFCTAQCSVRTKDNVQLQSGVSKSICQRLHIYEVGGFTFLQVRKQNKRDLIPMPVSPHYKVTARRDDTLFLLREDGTESLSAPLGRRNWKEQTHTSNLEVRMQWRITTLVFLQHETAELTVYTCKKPYMPGLYYIFTIVIHAP